MQSGCRWFLMRRPLRVLLIGKWALSWVVLAMVGWPASSARSGQAADFEFFEKEIRPILVGKCQECHGKGKVRGGLRLLDRASILKGGDSGPVVVPGQPAASLLVKALHYDGDLKMPPRGKLTAAEIARLERWIS